MEDKLGRERFFQESFLLTETSIEVVLRMSFLTLNNADIQFAEKRLTWNVYTTAKALSNTKWIKLINKKDFAGAALDEESKTFVMHIFALRVLSGSAKMMMHPLQAA